jgi:hypothetical protein
MPLVRALETFPDLGNQLECLAAGALERDGDTTIGWRGQ